VNGAMVGGDDHHCGLVIKVDAEDVCVVATPPQLRHLLAALRVKDADEGALLPGGGQSRALQIQGNATDARRNPFAGQYLKDL